MCGRHNCAQASRTVVPWMQPDRMVHYSRVTHLLEDFASAHPDLVVQQPGDTFVAADTVIDLIDEAERRGVGILGLEGFLLNDGDVYPSLDRIADFSVLARSSNFVEKSAAKARELLAGPWHAAPTPSEQMHPAATGRHMVVVVFDESVID
jgi:hypothetical protein